MTERSEKQKSARQRNWTILRLRGLYYQVPFEIDRKNRTDILRGIDRALIKLGAESETSRKERIHAAIVAGDMDTAVKIRTYKGHKNK